MTRKSKRIAVAFLMSLLVLVGLSSVSAHKYLYSEDLPGWYQHGTLKEGTKTSKSSTYAYNQINTINGMDYITCWLDGPGGRVANDTTCKVSNTTSIKYTSSNYSGSTSLRGRSATILTTGSFHVNGVIDFG